MKKFLTHLSLISLFLISSCFVLNGSNRPTLDPERVIEYSKIIYNDDNSIKINNPEALADLISKYYIDLCQFTAHHPNDSSNSLLIFENSFSDLDDKILLNFLELETQNFLKGNPPINQNYLDRVIEDYTNINIKDINDIKTKLRTKDLFNNDKKINAKNYRISLSIANILKDLKTIESKKEPSYKSVNKFIDITFITIISLYNNGFNKDGSIKNLLSIKIANYLLLYIEKTNKTNTTNFAPLKEYKNSLRLIEDQEILALFLYHLNKQTKKGNKKEWFANKPLNHNSFLDIFDNCEKFTQEIIKKQNPLKWDEDTFKATVDDVEIDLGKLENPEAIKAEFYEQKFLKIAQWLHENATEENGFERCSNLIITKLLQMPADILTQTAQPSAQPAQVTPANTASTTVVPPRRTLVPLRKPTAAKQQTAESATVIPVIQNLPPAMLPQPQTSTFNKKDYFYDEDNKINNQKINDDLIQALLWNNQYPIKMNNPTLVADIIKMLYEKNKDIFGYGQAGFSYEKTITQFDKNQYSKFFTENNAMPELTVINDKIITIIESLMGDIQNTLQENSTKFLTNAYAHKAMRIIIALYVNGFDQSGNVKDLLSIKLANYIILFLKHRTDYVKFEKLLSSLENALKDSYQDNDLKYLDERITNFIAHLNKQAAGTSTKEWLANPAFKHNLILDKKSNCEVFAEEIVKKQNPLRWDQDTFKATVHIDGKDVAIDLGQLENPEIIKADFYKQEFIKIAQWLHNAAQKDANEYGNFERIADLIINNLLQMPANTLKKIAATNAQPAILASQQQEAKASTSHHNRRIFTQDYPKQTIPTAVVSSKPAVAASQPIIDTDDRRVKGKQAAAYDDERDEEVVVTKTADTKQQLPSASGIKKERKPIVTYSGDQVFNLPPVNTQPSTLTQQKQEVEKTPEIKPQPAQPAGIVNRLWQGTKNVAQVVGNLLTEEASSSDEEDNGFGLFNELINKDRKYNNDYFVNNNNLNKFLVDFGSAENIIAIAQKACHAVASSSDYNKLFAGAIIRSLITLASCYKTNPDPAKAQLITALIAHPHTQNIQKQDCPAGSLSKLAAQAPTQTNQADLHNTIKNFTNVRK